MHVHSYTRLQGSLRLQVAVLGEDLKYLLRSDEKKEVGRGVVTRRVFKRYAERIRGKGAKTIKVESFRQKEEGFCGMKYKRNYLSDSVIKRAYENS